MYSVGASRFSMLINIRVGQRNPEKVDELIDIKNSYQTKDPERNQTLTSHSKK